MGSLLKYIPKDDRNKIRSQRIIYHFEGFNQNI